MVDELENTDRKKENARLARRTLLYSSLKTKDPSAKLHCDAMQLKVKTKLFPNIREFCRIDYLKLASTSN